MPPMQPEPSPLPEQPVLFEADAQALVTAAVPDAALLDLAARLHQRWGGRLHLGTSSWHFPGWAGLVWRRTHLQALLSREGLRAYAAHPLLRTVSLDRTFYRAADALTLARLAAQVPEHFRFVVKLPAQVTDASLRDAATAAALGPNPLFLDPAATLALAVQPALEGLGSRLGALVWQLSPLPPVWLNDSAVLHRQLREVFEATVPSLPPGCLAALELRDAALLKPELAMLLKDCGVRPVLGLHDRMPTVEEQLPLLRATWPGDLVCRWNLQRGQRYAQARDAWAPFDRMQAPDPATRQALARVARATLDHGHRVFVTINNKAEGSAPLSVRALAEALLA